MPSRRSSHGRHGDSDSSSSERKPYSVVRHRLSTPPTTAASQIPASIRRCACANTLALEAQALETVAAGPSSRRRRRTNSVSENMPWVAA